MSDATGRRAATGRGAEAGRRAEPEKRPEAERSAEGRRRRSSRRGRAARPVQGALPLTERNGWGGKREGAGRKPKGEKAGVPHRSRPPLASRFPVHVTMRVKKGVWNLRTHRAFDRRIAPALEKGRETKAGFRLVEYSVQGNHLHLVCEAKNADTLARGIQGLAIRIAKGLNAMMARRGSVFADRYHARILRTPREVRNVLAYVFGNFAKHAEEWAAKQGLAGGWATPAGGAESGKAGRGRGGARRPSRTGRHAGRPGLVDPYSSARHFRHFVGPVDHPRWGPRDPPAGAAPGTWLLREGWRKAGRIRLV